MIICLPYSHLNLHRLFVYIYIYIYIYIYSHQQTDCFIVSQLFSVARHVGRLKMGSKPAQLYVRLSILPLTLHVTYVSSGIIRHYSCFCFMSNISLAINSKDTKPGIIISQNSNNTLQLDED